MEDQTKDRMAEQVDTGELEEDLACTGELKEDLANKSELKEKPADTNELKEKPASTSELKEKPASTSDLKERQYYHRDTYAIRLVIGAAALCVFFLLHYLVTSRICLSFDLAVGEAVRSLRTPTLNAVLIPITHMANWKFLVGVGIALLAIDVVKWKKNDYPIAVFSCLITLLVYKILKVLVQRPRPSQILWLVIEHGYSFPSGHSMNGMFCYGMMIYLLWRNCDNKRLRNILTVLIGLLIPLIGFSRIYCGVHHPTDVLAGLSMGLAMLMFSTVVIDEILFRLNKKHTCR